MKVYVIDSQVISGYNYSIERGILEKNGHELILETCKSEDDIIEKCSDAEAIFNIATKMTEKSISKLKKCKVMVRYGIGYDEFDMEASIKQRIMICNVTTYCTLEVAVHALTLILACSRQVKHFDCCVASGVWNGSLGKKMRRPTTQTVGLVGFGKIPRKLAGLLKPIGYNVVAYDPYAPEAVFSETGVKKVELEELYAQADIISLHCPLTQENHHLVNKGSIAKMKDNVIIVNTARGPLVYDSDLVEGLNAGKIAAVGMDVLETEPLRDKEYPLCKMNNVILTPHIAYRTEESSAELFKCVAETAVEVFNGKVPENVLNAKALGLHYSK